MGKKEKRRRVSMLNRQSNCRSTPCIPSYLHKIRLFVRETNLTFLVKSSILQITLQLLIIHPWLQHNRLRPVIRQPTIMHQRTQPHLDPVLTPKLLLPNQTVEPTIIVPDTGDMLSEIILFGPIDLEIAEWFPVPASDYGKTVLGFEIVL